MKNRASENRILFGVFLFIIAWAPIPLGSNRPWSWSFLEFLILSLTFFYSLAIAREGKIHSLNLLIKSRWIIIFFSAHLFYILVQCLPIPVEWFTVLSASKAAWYSPETIKSSLEFGRLNASYPEGIATFYKQLSYYLMFCLVLILVNSRRRLFTVLTVMVLVSSAEAIYGSLANLMGDGFSLWRPTSGNLAGGTFVNKNHFAALLSIGIGLCLGIGFYYLSLIEFKRDQSLVKRTLFNLNSIFLGPVGFVIGILTLLLIGITLSSSIGALLALSLSVTLIITIGALVKGKSSAERLFLPYLLTLLTVVIVIMPNENIIDRFSMLLFQDSSRWLHWQQSWEMFTDHWIVGVGAGAYQFVFTQYKSGAYTHYLIDFAHNDYLQFFVEQGVVGMLLWCSAIIILILRIFRSYINSGLSRRYQGLMLGMLVSILAFMMHSFVDFNFYIPALALWFYLVLGLALVLSNRIDLGRWR